MRCETKCLLSTRALAGSKQFSLYISYFSYLWYQRAMPIPFEQKLLLKNSISSYHSRYHRAFSALMTWDRRMTELYAFFSHFKFNSYFIIAMLPPSFMCTSTCRDEFYVHFTHIVTLHRWVGSGVSFFFWVLRHAPNKTLVEIWKKNLENEKHKRGPKKKCRIQQAEEMEGRVWVWRDIACRLPLVLVVCQWSYQILWIFNEEFCIEMSFCGFTLSPKLFYRDT